MPYIDHLGMCFDTYLYIPGNSFCELFGILKLPLQRLSDLQRSGITRSL